MRENKKYPSEYLLKFIKQIYKDSFVLQFLVQISNKVFVFTKVYDKKHFMNTNLNTLTHFSDYLCFSKTYKTSDNLYICENKTFSYSLKYLFKKDCEKIQFILKKLGFSSKLKCKKKC